MSTYSAICRTNYFKVIDKEKYQELIDCINNKIEFHSKAGNGFGAYGELSIKIPPSKLKTNTELQQAIDNNAVFNEDGTHINIQDIDTLDLLFDKNNNILYSAYEDGIGIEDFIQELQPNLPEGECFIYIEIGHENLRYLSGTATIATRNDIQYVTLDDKIKQKVTEMLGPCKTPIWTY